MAYIEWWNRTGPVTLGERFGLNEISTRAKTLSPTKSYAEKPKPWWEKTLDPAPWDKPEKPWWEELQMDLEELDLDSMIIFDASERDRSKRQGLTMVRLVRVPLYQIKTGDLL